MSTQAETTEDRNQDLVVDLAQPHFENGKALLIAGLRERYSHAKTEGIPSQWQRFASYLGNIDGQLGREVYGVCCNRDDTGKFDYITGVEVADVAGLPAELSSVSLSEQRYAIFSHRGHISTISGTICTIWNKWLPESGYNANDAPFFERYPDDFDPEKSLTGVEIWVPIKS